MKKLIALLTTVAVTIVVLSLAVGNVAFGGQGNAGGTKGARLTDQVTDGTTSYGTLAGSGTLTGDIGADEGSTTWEVFSSDFDIAPEDPIAWDEKNTNVHAYYYLTVSHATVSVTSQGTNYTWTPDDWIFFQTSGSATNYYFRPSYSVTLGAGGATITEPAGVVAEGEGTLSVTYLSYNGTTPTLSTVNLYFAFDNDTKRLYIDDDPDMTEVTDTANGLTAIANPTEAVAYSQGKYLENDGDEFTFEGTKFVITSDPQAMTGVGSSVNIATGFFCPYTKTKSDCLQSIHTLIAVEDTFPGGKALSWTITINNVQHSTP